MTTSDCGAAGPWDIPGLLRRALMDSGLGGPGGGPFGPPGARPGPPPGGRARPRGGPWGGGRKWDWGPGSWDPWSGGPGPRGSQRHQRGRAGRGDVRSAVLALLAEQPMHGYQIIQEIERRSHGAWKPSPGSVYPTLQQLEDEGLVRAAEQDGRRVYRLTDDGRRITAEKADEYAGMWDAFAPQADDTQLGDLVFQVGAAFVHVMRTGTDEQIAQARTVLARTRTDLYRILGQDGQDGQDDGEGGQDRPTEDGGAS
ncbi:PadR family transcriptional regulator [Nakamurella sp.]|uniref:PadR family transcriptional regulator n=1 Tax=Nakamurella sp. TaxID=1869182 RepID=UPI003B3AF4D6